MIPPLDAIVLGLVEGLTEFLPVSSTGHLILTAHWLGLQGEAVKTFEIVIQAGALVAVLWLYRRRIASLWRAVASRDADGRRLWRNLLISFLPAAVAGVAFHRAIKASLFHVGPVIAALAVGGVAMIGFDHWARSTTRSARTLDSVTTREAFLIGLAQCLSLWPGTSRAMVTLVAGMLVGLPSTAAAEYSFLLAVPTLGAATVFDALKGHEALLRDIGAVSMACGFLTSTLVAALVVRGFLRYLTRRGVALFGWYRLGLAAAVWWLAPRF